MFKGTVPKLREGTIVSKFNNGHWIFPEQMNAGKYSGFIYVIRDNYLNRFYLGKKSYQRKTKGITEESDWRRYKSSSNLLKEMFGERPKEEFEFFCLEEYKTKGTLSYAETWSLCYVEAPTSLTWYNVMIGKVTWAVKEPISERHKRRLNQIINGEQPT